MQNRAAWPAAIRTGLIAALLMMAASAHTDELERSDQQIAAAAAAVGANMLARDPENRYGKAFVDMAKALDPENEVAEATLSALARGQTVEAPPTRISPKQLVRGIKKRVDDLYAEDVAENPHYGRRALLYLRVARLCMPDDEQLERGIAALARKGFDDDLEALLAAPAALRKPGVALAVSGDLPDHVPEDAEFFNGHWYRLIDSYKDWDEACSSCLALSGYLVCIDSAEENEFVYKLTRGQRVWLGATDRYSEGSWYWVSGQAMAFANWAPGQPSGGRHNHFLTYLDVDIDKPVWADEHRGWSRQFICEWEVEPWTPKRAAQAQRDALLEAAPEFRGHRYVFISEQMTWDEAREFAENMGGTLAIISSSKENDFVHELAGARDVWLGATDRDRPDFFRWVDGRRIAWNNWGEYGLYEDNRPSYLYMNEDGQWRQASSADWREAFVVEIEPPED